MKDFEKSLVIQVISEPDTLIASRQWDVLTEGVFISELYAASASGTRAALLRYLPGAAVAAHRHPGYEHILILQGSQQDGDVIYGVGDLVIHKPETSHDLISKDGCLALGIWEKPVEFIDASNA